MGVRTGGVLDSVTTIVKDFTSDSGGTPSSVTLTLTRLVDGPWASEGVQVKTPLVGLMLAPAGALVSRLKVNVLEGESRSVAVLVNDSKEPSTMTRFEMANRVGAVLTSWTVTLKDLVSNKAEVVSLKRT